MHPERVLLGACNCQLRYGGSVPEERGSSSAGSEDYGDYISDMLAELADLASAKGDRRLAVNLRMAALEAAREQSEPEEA